jgi:hypothetical protein
MVVTAAPLAIAILPVLPAEPTQNSSATHPTIRSTTLVERWQRTNITNRAYLQLAVLNFDGNFFWEIRCQIDPRNGWMNGTGGSSLVLLHEHEEICSLPAACP